jgi:hypothetical protein
MEDYLMDTAAPCGSGSETPLRFTGRDEMAQAIGTGGNAKQRQGKQCDSGVQNCECCEHMFLHGEQCEAVEGLVE